MDRVRLIAAVLLAGLMAGCSSTTAAPTDSAGLTPAATSPRAAAPATTPAAVSTGRPAFLSTAFTDVRDGTQFRLSDFPGKTVLVLGMAVW